VPQSTHAVFSIFRRSFEVDDDKRVDRQDGIKRLYIEEDIHLRDSNGKLKSDVQHGICGSTSKKENLKKRKG
jgi:putative uncharacterized protein (fragment)